MAEEGARQALAAAFALSVSAPPSRQGRSADAREKYSGIVASASFGTAALYLRAGASPPFRDGPRLVLVVFLASAFLWALAGFIATLIDRGAAEGCQVAVAFASAFDQLAKTMLEEFLFWAIKPDIQASLAVLLPQAVIVTRLVLGGVFVGVQRPQFNPVCVGTTLVLGLGVAVLVADAVIVLMLLFRASSVGLFRPLPGNTVERDRSKALVAVTLALPVWIAVSPPSPADLLASACLLMARPAGKHPHDSRHRVLRARHPDSACCCWPFTRPRYAPSSGRAPRLLTFASSYWHFPQQSDREDR